MAGAWGASGPQWGASLTSSQYFPAPQPAEEEGNLWADLLKGNLTFWTRYFTTYNFPKMISNSNQKKEVNFMIIEVAANKHSILPSRNLLVLGDRDR